MVVICVPDLGRHYFGERFHDDVIKWKHFARYWPFVRPPHKGQWRGALMFSLTCAWINGWVNNREDGDLRRYRTHYDVVVMYCLFGTIPLTLIPCGFWRHLALRTQVIIGPGKGLSPNSITGTNANLSSICRYLRHSPKGNNTDHAY